MAGETFKLMNGFVEINGLFFFIWLLVEKDKITPPSGMTINRRLMKDIPTGASYFKLIKVNSVEYYGEEKTIQRLNCCLNF